MSGADGAPQGWQEPIEMNATLQELADSARGMGFRPAIINTGGNVMGLSLVIDGAAALVSLGADGDWGYMSGTHWTVSLDGETRETYGEADAGELPITSDADQTIADAAAWVRWQVAAPARRAAIDAAAARVKLEIIEDIRAGVVPADVADFSDLHSHTDANMYGGELADALWSDVEERERMGEDPYADINAMQGIIDRWILTGGIATALAED